MDAKLKIKYGDLEVEFEGSETWLNEQLPTLLARLLPEVASEPASEQETRQSTSTVKPEEDNPLADLSREDQKKKDPFAPQGMAYRPASNDPNASTIALRPELP